MQGRGDPNQLEVDLIRDPQALDAIAGEWRALAQEHGNAFLTPEWFRTWHSHYGDDEEPYVLVARDGGRVAGVLPLALERRGRRPTARFGGSGLGDHFGLLTAPERTDYVAGAIGTTLGEHGRPNLVLENVDEAASWWDVLARAGGYAGRPPIGRRTTLPHIAFAGRSWDEYMASRSRNLRSQLGRKRRALERDHDVAFRWTGPDGNAADDIATLFRLHDLRWAARSGESSLTSERARSFHADFAAAAQALGWLRLAILEVDAEPVAAWYGWRIGDRFAYYQAGFDPEWQNRSVGLVLFAETIRTAAEEGAGEYDMLLGDEDFKLRFADSERRVCTALVAPRASRARIAARAEVAMRRVVRSLPDSARATVTRRTQGLRERLAFNRRR
jgi:CelD/BcsL family acetyltransferase involved in cellulose biosynthesis